MLSLTPLGVCNTCAPVIQLDVGQRLRILKDSVALVDQGKTLGTRLSRCDLVIEHARALAKYHDRGVSVLTVEPARIVAEYQGRRAQLVVTGLREDLEAARRKASCGLSPKATVYAYSKLAIMVQDYKTKVGSLKDLEDLQEEVTRLIDDTVLSDHLEMARKYEFKGQNKKALDRYYEALYLLRHDSVPDYLQTQHIRAIESKIRELGGEVR